MGPVNLKNPNFSFSVRFTVKNAILDRTFTRLSKFQLLDLELEFSISGQLPDSEFLFSRRDNSYFQFHRMPILMRYPITARLRAVPDFNFSFSSHFTNASAGSKRRTWRSLAFAACAGFSISFLLSKIFTGMACSHCCRQFFISFNNPILSLPKSTRSIFTHDLFNCI